jgi:hypothetical protein
MGAEAIAAEHTVDQDCFASLAMTTNACATTPTEIQE